MQDGADVARRAPARIAVVVGDERAQVRGIALLGGELGRIDERADLVLWRAGGTATRERERRGEQQAISLEDNRPIAAGRP